MTSSEFCYWLQGYFELSGDQANSGLNPDQTEVIKRHLALVFVHDIDPSQGGPEHQATLQAIHDGSEAEHVGPIHGSDKATGPKKRC